MTTTAISEARNRSPSDMPSERARYPVYMLETVAWHVTHSRVIFSDPSRRLSGTTSSSKSDDSSFGRGPSDPAPDFSVRVCTVGAIFTVTPGLICANGQAYFDICPSSREFRFNRSEVVP